MFLKKPGMTSAESYPAQTARLKTEIETADAIVIGAGAGMSISAGLTYNGERFKKYFSDFHEKYGINDMYAGGFYPYDTLEEYWAWWSRHILMNRYEVSAGKPYSDLLRLVKDKEYFVLTTNVDHQFQLAGFDKTRLFYTQGDYGLWQCSEACHDKTYDNKAMVYRMASEQRDMKIPADLIPKCPVCGRPMTMNLRCDDTFVQDEGWYAAAARYDDFIRRCEERHVLFMELGVGGNTPGIIKYPFWKMTAKNPEAVFACVNYGEAVCPKEIACRSVCINGDIGKVIHDLL